MPKKTTAKKKGKDAGKTKKGKSVSSKKKKKKNTNMERMLEQIGVAKCPNLETIRKSIGKQMFLSNREPVDENAQMGAQKMGENDNVTENIMKKTGNSKSKYYIQNRQLQCQYINLSDIKSQML